MGKRFMKLLVLIFFIICCSPVWANECPPYGSCDIKCCKEKERLWGIDLQCDEDPVDPMGGKLYFSLVDLTFGDYAQYTEVSQLYVKRFLSTQNSYKSVFGVNWCSNLDIGITVTSEAVILRNEFGGLIQFVKGGIVKLDSPICSTSGMFEVPAGYIWRLRYGSEFFFERVTKDEFTGYRLAWVKDRFGKKLVYKYDDDIFTTVSADTVNTIYYYPVKILQEHTGRYLNIEWIQIVDPSEDISYYVKSVTDSSGRRMQYEYKQLEFSENIHYLNRVTDPLGHSFVYDFIVKDIDAEKKITAYVITNKRGYDTTYYFNEPFAIPTHNSDWNWSLRVEKLVDALGSK